MGQIWEVGQKGTLNYISLMRQIKDVGLAWYEQSEIISAVIHVMASNLTLQNVLDTAANL